MSDREIYSYRDNLADLVVDLKNGQRGLDTGSGDWVVKDYSGVTRAMLSYKHWSGSAWVYDPITLGQITLGLTPNRILTTDGNSIVTAATLTDIGAQPSDPDLGAIAGLTGAGIATRISNNTWLLRSVAVSGNGISVANGDGVADNPTLSLSIGTGSTQVASGNHNHGTGTINYLTKWSNTTGGLSSSLLFDSGSSIGLGTSSPSSLLHLNATSSLWLSIENDVVGNDLFQIGLSSAGKATFRSNYSGFSFLGIPYLGQSETDIFGISANNIVIGYPSYINYSRTDLYGTVAVDAIYFDRTNLTVSNLTTVKVTDLTDGGDTTLHYHSADRDRGNHTGNQAISTITNLQTALDGKSATTHNHNSVYEPILPVATSFQYYLRGDKQWGLFNDDVRNAVWTSLTSGYIPYYNGTNLVNSFLQHGSKSVKLRAVPSSWGSNFSAYEVGLCALWANHQQTNGYGFVLSNNRHHTGSGNFPIVSGSSSSYYQDGSSHVWQINTGLTAGVVFTPGDKMKLFGTGTLELYSVDDNYNGGLRIVADSTHHGVIALGCAAGGGGTQVGQWNITRYPSNMGYGLGFIYNATDIFRITNSTISNENGSYFRANTLAGSVVSGGNIFQTGLEVFQPTLSTDAFMAFHVSGDYAGYFGLDGATNDLFWGGWSVGAKHRILHTGNIDSLFTGFHDTHKHKYLWSTSDPDVFYLTNDYRPVSGTHRWRIVSNHSDNCSVAHSDYSTSSGNSDTLDGYHASSFQPLLTSLSTNYLPVWNSSTLVNSQLVTYNNSITLGNSALNWSPAFSVFQLGNLAIWGNSQRVNAYGGYLSNNRFHDGTGNKPFDSGVSTTFEIGTDFVWYANSSLTAGVAFTPIEVMRVTNDGNMWLRTSGGDGITFSGQNGTDNNIISQAASGSTLNLISSGASINLYGSGDGMGFSGNAIFNNDVTVMGRLKGSVSRGAMWASSVSHTTFTVGNTANIITKFDTASVDGITFSNSSNTLTVQTGQGGVYLISYIISCKNSSLAGSASYFTAYVNKYQEGVNYGPNIICYSVINTSSSTADWIMQGTGTLRCGDGAALSLLLACTEEGTIAIGSVSFTMVRIGN